ncbi:Serine/threonine-protein kinase 35 [Stylophora pistillata]|uniref:Serine/threonine-protein kinase 35 n=1 Tax=Stylophora pistillata TaxID=50429 RepID=A0A2B4S3C3_STYPI|nr:Serine/threonine-protein kinase 35 [Stylophora pistillata]
MAQTNLPAPLQVGDFHDRQALHMLLLTEYCPGGSLNDRLARPSSDQQNLKWMIQTTKAVAYLHSCNVVHRDLKADNVLLTASEDVKLGDFGLAREYIALKRAGVRQDDGSWLSTYTEYYMESGIGPIHWVAPEFFRHHYTEKADVFSLGTLLFAILERDFITIDGKAMYGAFVHVPGIGKIGVGFAMENVDINIRIQFSSRAQGSTALQSIVLGVLKYNKNDRPSAQDICNDLRVIKESIRLVESPPEAGSCC